MSAPSIKSMIKDGTAKRADAVKFRIEDIHEEPGFNLRREGEDLEASIDALAAHIVGGGMVPPLEVRPRAEGGVYLVDGHRRRRAFLKVADAMRDPDGNLWIPVVQFTGNDADRVARIITSAEGRGLAPLEIADGYKRLIAFGWTAEQIAKKVCKTPAHVSQMLTLANANSDVHAAVAAGDISATNAVKMVRDHGDNAGAAINDAVKVAKAAGKSKATAATFKPKAIPATITNDGMLALHAVFDALNMDDHAAIASADLTDTDATRTVVLPLASLVALSDIVGQLNAHHEAQDKAKREAEAKAAQTELV